MNIVRKLQLSSKLEHYHSINEYNTACLQTPKHVGQWTPDG